MKTIQIKAKTMIYFGTFFFTGLGLLHEFLKQQGIDKIKQVYWKKLSAKLHKVGIVEDNKDEGYVITGGYANVVNSRIYYLDAQVKGQSEEPVVVLLHSQQFSANTWLKLEVLHELANAGYRTITVDLPGYGGSDKADMLDEAKEKVRFLERLMNIFQLQDIVFITPGISGEFVIPFIFESQRTDRMAAWVPISPDGVKVYSDKDFQNLARDLPTLIFYGEYDSAGELDSRRLLKIRGAEKKIIYSASKHCYVDDPKYFMDNLLLFLQSLPISASL